MNAEALIGMVLGNCTLQKLVGQGGMGAVYLAQQTRPRRQVAIKVLLPMTPLNPDQLAAFLERFRRETDAAASLEHPHIMPVYEYGENDGIAYLVMPYISGGTLRDELEREGPLPLPMVVNYLEQVAAALDFAHEHGVIHRDIKPANIMVTTDKRLLLTDFGLVKIISGVGAAQVQKRLTGAGAPVGTPDYMAPEQVIGEEIDTRADLYSLGIILYQLVTGTTPFQGETPMQIAAQHLQIPPPSPQLLRPDLPIAAEQVILRSLAKLPTDRYMYARDLADAFRVALNGSGVALEDSYTRSVMLITSSRFAAAQKSTALAQQFTQSAKLPAAEKLDTLQVNTNGQLPSVTQNLPLPVNAAIPAPPAGGGLLSRTGKFPMVGTGVLPRISAVVPALPAGGGLLSRTGKFPMVGTGLVSAVQAKNQPVLPPILEQPSAILRNTTGSFALPGSRAPKATRQLSGPVNVVKVPVAGQLGQYVTGSLPVASSAVRGNTNPQEGISKTQMKIALIFVVAVILLGSIGIFLFEHNHLAQPHHSMSGQKALSAAALQATGAANAAATATAANIVLSDPLDRNVHGWAQQPANAFTFKDGAYYVTDDQIKGRATVLGINSLPSTLNYTLTIEQTNGNDALSTDSFGMLFRCNQRARPSGGAPITTFYSFEVVNIKAGDYQFWKYDDTNQQNPWKQIQNGKLPFGKEYHQGKGVQAINTFSIFMQASTFTIAVNGTRLSRTFQDNSFQSGTVGMIVNQQGVQVAFKDLLLTRK